MDSNGEKKAPAWQKFHTFILLQIVISAIFFTYFRGFSTHKPVSSPRHVPAIFISSTDKQSRDSFRNYKKYLNSSLNPIILLWKMPFGSDLPSSRCSKLMGTPDCYITVNRSLYQKADAIIMYHLDVFNSTSNLPQETRPLSQRWIWFNMESPTHSPNVIIMDNRFNLTMSYRRDSDIFTPYGWLEVLKQPQNITIPSKSKLLAWVVSNWENPKSRRVKYYNKLKKYIKVDVYGQYHMSLPENKHLSTLSQYKFYLAFENSIHEDYITEKLWKNAFLAKAVPIVCGPPRKNYERHVPPDSFIHIDDFRSARKLAKFLQVLDKNTAQYQSYFQWQSWLKPIGDTYWDHHICKACHYLHRTPIQYQSVPELSKWFK